VSVVPAKKTSRHVPLSADRSDALAQAIKARRARQGLTQEEVSREAGMSTEHWQRLERGVANPTLGTLYAAADALGVPLPELLPL
jgi:transcriptional regulator with XRE-family HTH domain